MDEDWDDAPTEAEVDAFQAATRDLVGMAVRSLDLLGAKVTLDQFRMLGVLEERGPLSAARIAHELRLRPSTITWLADHLEADGFVERSSDPDNPDVVTLEPTAAGRDLVAQVMQWRRAELARILSRLSSGARAGLAAGLRRLHSVVGDGSGGLAGSSLL